MSTTVYNKISCVIDLLDFVDVGLNLLNIPIRNDYHEIIGTKQVTERTIKIKNTDIILSNYLDDNVFSTDYKILSRTSVFPENLNELYFGRVIYTTNKIQDINTKLLNNEVEELQIYLYNNYNLKITPKIISYIYYQ